MEEKKICFTLTTGAKSRSRTKKTQFQTIAVKGQSNQYYHVIRGRKSKKLVLKRIIHYGFWAGIEPKTAAS